MTNNAKHPQINLLLTRPMAGSITFWEALGAELQGSLRPIISPLIQITPRNVSFQNLAAVIFSSVNGVEHGPIGRGRTAYCVGANTTHRALARGWNAIQSGETASLLISTLLKTEITEPLTHLCGVHTRGSIAEHLSQAGIPTARTIVYEQEFCELTEEGIEALSSNFPLLVPLFSPRTASRFVELNKGQAPLHIIALSEEVAGKVAGHRYQSLTVSNRPTRLAMIDEIQKLVSRVTLG